MFRFARDPLLSGVNVQSSSPVAASIASMVLPALAAKSTPSCTSGVEGLGPGLRVCDQTNCSSDTFASVICVSGLKP